MDKLDENSTAGIIRELRERRSLGEEEAERLIGAVGIDLLRNQIRSTDVPLLLELANDEDKPWCRSFAVSLMRSVESDTSIRDFLFRSWASETDYPMRLAIMWRLLDYNDLDISMHRSIYKFVKTNWEQWKKDMRKWYGPHKVLGSVEYRLADESFPKSKAWVYLCLAMVSDNMKGIHSLLSQYVDSRESIVGEVAIELTKIIENDA